MKLSRRTFVKKAMTCTASACLGIPLTAGRKDDCPYLDDHVFYRYEASYYEKLDDLRLECRLCPRKCQVGDTEVGYCGVRENCRGEYFTLVYGNPCAVNIDPIEKKPFYHFYPGSDAFSIATAGCNVNCEFCQNWQISQVGPRQTDNRRLPPGELVRLCQEHKAPIIAYTYSEPIVFFEYMLEAARCGKGQGLKNVVITGGYINPEPLRELLGTVDAVKVDLKAFSEKYYSEVVHGELKPVLQALEAMVAAGTWTEIVYLVVPGLNDDRGEVAQMCRWIARELGQDVPVHFSRFYPQYKLRDLPPTPVKTLTELWKLAQDSGLKYSYVGNVPGHPGENTYCPQCEEIVIKRTGYSVSTSGLEGGKCKKCGSGISGRWREL